MPKVSTILTEEWSLDKQDTPLPLGPSCFIKSTIKLHDSSHYHLILPKIKGLLVQCLKCYTDPIHYDWKLGSLMDEIR